MIIYGRDARIGPRSFKHLFSGSYRNPEANRLSGIYELSLRRANEAGSPGRSLVAWFCSRLTAQHEIDSKFLSFAKLFLFESESKSS
jgi:hypothetical protein